MFVSGFIFIFSLVLQAAIYKLSSSEGKITFLAKGKPALISIKGEGEGVSATLSEKDQLLSGEISFNLKSLKTGIPLRDDHLQNKYLEVEKFPVATLKILNLKLPTDFKNEFSFNAILNLHGVDRPIDGRATVSGESNSKTVSADFKISLSQFNIEIPSFKGITVAEEVQIKVEVPFVQDQ